MSLPLPEHFVGLSMENGEPVLSSAKLKGKTYLFTESDIYVVEDLSWLSIKWTAVKKWFQTFWNVGWELPK